VFVLFEPAPLIFTFTPIYEACTKLGYRAEGEAILRPSIPRHLKLIVTSSSFFLFSQQGRMARAH
jgi:hypothetical protein